MSGSHDPIHEVTPNAPGTTSRCTCIRDPFAGLPAELRPQPQPRRSGLRQVTCPGCGTSYWTNRATDLCIECEKKRPQDQKGEAGG